MAIMPNEGASNPPATAAKLEGLLGPFIMVGDDPDLFVDEAFADEAAFLLFSVVLADPVLVVDDAVADVAVEEDDVFWIKVDVLFPVALKGLLTLGV